VSATARPARWWEIPRSQQRQGKQGRLVSPVGRDTGITCPVCGAAPVVYNGNYFCDNWSFPFSSAEGECDWALAHPARTKRDREFCDLVGIDHH
jgi:hypothetical protein